MGQHTVLVYTHDSIGQGEDGPTHQPVEQLANLRLTPNMSVWRPCDTAETAVAWKAAVLRDGGPTSLVLSRQGLPHQQRSAKQLADVARGGYVLTDCDGEPELIVIATGSEVEIQPPGGGSAAAGWSQRKNGGHAFGGCVLKTGMMLTGRVYCRLRYVSASPWKPESRITGTSW